MAWWRSTATPCWPPPEGDAVTEEIREGERERLRRYVAEWPGGDEPEVEALVEQLTHQLLADHTDTVEHT